MDRNVQNDNQTRLEHFKSADIRVLMLGAKRVGKTSQIGRAHV